MIRIYKNSTRKTTQTAVFRSFCTFKNENLPKNEFFVQVCNEDTLKTGAKEVFTLPLHHCLLVLPLAGGVFYQNEDRTDGSFIDIGEATLLSKPKAHIYTLSNEYDTNDYESNNEIRNEIITPQPEPLLISFLQIQWLSPNNSTLQQHSVFDFNKTSNTLIPLFPTVFIGKYAGRHEDVFSIENPKSDVFVLVIEGAFEVDNRLVETKDALSFSGRTEGIEFEALSEGAILLIIVEN